MSPSSAVAIPKPEGLDPHRILENDIDNFEASRTPRVVLLQSALDDSCAYAEQLWNNLDALRRYLLDSLPPEPGRHGRSPAGAAPTGPDDEQGWQKWMTAFAGATSVLCGPHGDSGFGRQRAEELARARRAS
jgi:hypothetical protein